MRLSHLKATLLLAALVGCSTNASPTATTGTPASAECLAAFDRYNVDKDTTLSYDEFVAGKWGDIRFIKAPTAQEEADAKARFRADAEKADADKDGRLARAEYATTCP